MDMNEIIKSLPDGVWIEIDKPTRLLSEYTIWVLFLRDTPGQELTPYDKKTYDVLGWSEGDDFDSVVADAHENMAATLKEEPDHIWRVPIA